MLNSLQACRAVAALLVVLNHANYSMSRYHGNRPVGAALDFAPAAIDFFFVLSGFIILYVHTPDIGRPRQIGAFLWKRFARILPLYWIVLAAVLPVYFLVPRFGMGFERDPAMILRSFFLLPHPQNHIIVGVAWTLVFESLFYLFVAVLVLNRKLGVALIAAWTAGCLAHSWIESFPWSFVFNHMHLRFVVGMATCVIFQNYRIPCPRLVAALGVGIFAVLGIADVSYGLGHWVGIVGYTLSSAAIIVGLGTADRAGSTQAPGWLVYLGDRTYSIYLVHALALSALAKLSAALHLEQFVPLPPLYLLHVAGAIGLGCLCYRWIEFPFYSWTKQFFREASPAPAAETASQVEVRAAA